MDDDAELSSFDARGKLQLNLAHAPEHTYIFDDYGKEELENVLDKIKFFSDVELGLSMEDMILEHKILSNVFMPVCTFDDSTMDS